MMILALVQQPRGVLHVLFAGDYAKAKAWVRAQYGEAPARYSAAKWKTPGDCEYWQSKQRGWAVEQPVVAGPVAMKFVKEQEV